MNRGRDGGLELLMPGCSTVARGTHWWRGLGAALTHQGEDRRTNSGAKAGRRGGSGRRIELAGEVDPRVGSSWPAEQWIWQRRELAATRARWRAIRDDGPARDYREGIARGVYAGVFFDFFLQI